MAVVSVETQDEVLEILAPVVGELQADFEDAAFLESIGHSSNVAWTRCAGNIAGDYMRYHPGGFFELVRTAMAAKCLGK